MSSWKEFPKELPRHRQSCLVYVNAARKEELEEELEDEDDDAFCFIDLAVFRQENGCQYWAESGGNDTVITQWITH